MRGVLWQLCEYLPVTPWYKAPIHASFARPRHLLYLSPTLPRCAPVLFALPTNFAQGFCIVAAMVIGVPSPLTAIQVCMRCCSLVRVLEPTEILSVL